MMEELQTLYTKEILINFIHKIPQEADLILMKIVWQNLLSNAVNTMTRMEPAHFNKLILRKTTM
ncbi:MAG: hypothetical protein IPG00_15145 [Saprospiraceae bacterium]|nr:hypothetical protein [Saprospiraceae bacterium]